MSATQKLPEELLAVILSHIDVGSLVEFALTCRRFYQISTWRLEQNQQYHKEYRIAHDRLPLTIPNLLRAVIAGSDVSWHIRVLETWGVRPFFSDWKTWDFWYGISAERGQAWPEPAEDHTHLTSSYFAPQEYQQFMLLMTGLVSSRDKVAEYLKRVEEGGDEALKGMLITLLPGLRKLNLLTHVVHRCLSIVLIAYSSSTDDFRDTAVHSLNFLADAIKCFSYDLDIPSSTWPPGFQSLREVSVSTSTPYQHPHDAWYPTEYSVSWLFLLPALKILHLSLIGIGGNEEEGTWNLNANSSSIEELTFYVSEMAAESWDKFVRAPRRLRSFTAEACVSNNSHMCDAIWKALEIGQGQWLEELHLESNPYQTSFVSMQRNFPKLRIFGYVLDLHLLKHKTSPNDLAFRSPCTTNIHSQRKRKEKNEIFQIMDLTCALPTTLEVLWLGVPSTRYQGGESTLSARAIRTEVLRAIADLVENDKFSSLEEICLATFLDERGTNDNILADRDELALQRIRKKGIETHLFDAHGKNMTNQQHYDLHHEGAYKRAGIESDPFPEGLHDSTFLDQDVDVNDGSVATTHS